MEAIKNTVTESFLETLQHKLGNALQDSEIDYLRHYYHRLSGQDYDESRALEFHEIALRHRECGQVRKPGQVIIESYNQKTEGTSHRNTEYTMILLVVDDMPFLISSLLMKLNSIFKTPERFLHPLFAVARGRNNRARSFSEGHQPDPKMSPRIESYIHCAIEYTPHDEHQAIKDALLYVIEQIRASVEDWLTIKDNVNRRIAEIESTDSDSELSDLLKWINNDHFAFLGYCEVEEGTQDGAGETALDPGTLLGNLKTAHHKGIDVAETMLPPIAFPDHVSAVYTKARARAEIYFPGYMDCILIRHAPADSDGPVRVSCVVGFLARASQIQENMSIPYIREKIAWALEQGRLRKDGHAYKELRSLLTTLPRDKLLQMHREELYRLGMTLLNQERRKTRLHLHRNVCGHFYSCLVYVPRDLFNSALRAKIQEYMRVVFQASEVEFDVYFSHSILTRIHYIIHTDPDTPVHFDQAQLESDVQNISRDWNDSLFEQLKEIKPYSEARDLYGSYHNAFPVAYQEFFSIQSAIADIAVYEDMVEGEVRCRLASSQRTDAGQIEGPGASFKIYSKNITLVLSDVLPILENMGVRVLRERPYRINRKDTKRLGLLDFDIVRSDSKDFDFKVLSRKFEELFVQCWNGQTENDGYNSLTLLAGLDWRQISVFRAYFRYLKQIRLRYSEHSIIETMNRYPDLASDIWYWFEARLSPVETKADTEALHEWVCGQLSQVSTLNEERIINALTDIIAATVRTNYFQPREDGTPKPYLSFKLDSGSIPRIPEPAPLYEIFVYSPRVEGIHLRGGKVARGGLRWSDRHEDFRTEVLGLVKAQRVKNAVIVPVGSKGGFVTKQLPENQPEMIQKEVIACYRTFIRGLLDLTDNIAGTDITPPDRVKRLDDDDPYLVVAADKGTATFSDIANDVADSYGFWLGDAFASGGSAGYDHKRMGITARGAWESVKRHFRELGKDVQTQPFTVVGIGDMSGDVFGNGMLLSRQTRIVAAFNHLHIVIDPDPDPETSYKERERLFALPRSSWSDYNPDCLSRGGAVYSRQDKSITLSPEAMKALGTETSTYAPDDLIHTLLKADVDLLWNGGIGTYVKASSETHSDAQDRNNDGLRVDASELHCKVVGEGGNLGMTQLGRIEFASLGGRCYTDAIDNSGGVDTSDHEVNLKILLNTEVQDGSLSMDERNRILSKMEEDVAELVLSNNYQQTQIVSVEAESGKYLMSQHIRTISLLEEDGLLDREIEFLPGHDELIERMAEGRHLTRPELAVVLAYSKMDLYRRLLESDFPDNAYLLREIEDYFPELVRDKYRTRIHDHRLKREIIATQVTNNLIGCMGSSFHLRVQDLTGKPVHHICSAYMIARDSSAYRELAQGIEDLDNRVDAALQMEAFNRLCRSMESTIVWILRNIDHPGEIQALIDRYAEPYLELCRNLDSVLSSAARDRYLDLYNRFIESGFPKDLAGDIAGRDILNNGIDIVEMSLKHSRPVPGTGRIFFEVADVLSIDWIYKQVATIDVDNIWHERARFSLLNALRVHHTDIVDTILSDSTGSSEEEALSIWSGKNEESIRALDLKTAALQQEAHLDFSMLSVIVSELDFIR